MKARMFGFALAAACLVAAQLQGQTPATPVTTQSLAYIKVPVGKSEEFLKFVREASLKIAQVRADAGEIVSYTVLRSVYPAGEEARANFLVSTLMEGPPRRPVTRDDTEKNLKKAGVTMSVGDYYAKRDSLTTLVALEMWQPKTYVGGLKKGQYLFINMMKARDGDAYL